MQHLRARSDSMLKINKKKLYRFVYSSVSLLQSQETIALTSHLAIVYQQNKKSLIEGRHCFCLSRWSSIRWSTRRKILFLFRGSFFVVARRDIDVVADKHMLITRRARCCDFSFDLLKMIGQVGGVWSFRGQCKHWRRRSFGLANKTLTNFMRTGIPESLPMTSCGRPVFCRSSSSCDNEQITR